METRISPDRAAAAKKLMTGYKWGIVVTRTAKKHFNHIICALHRWGALAVLPLGLCFLEGMLRLTASLSAAHLFEIFLAAISCGLLLDLLCMITKNERANGWIAFALMEFFTIWFLVAYFTDNAYHVFMDPASIFSGAGDVMTGFGDTLVNLIVAGIPVILLYHIPSILLLVFRSKLIFRRNDWKQPLILGVALLILGGASALLMTRSEIDRNRYTKEYSYDTGVRQFGALTSLRLHLRYSLFGNPYESGFEIIPHETDQTDSPIDPDDPKETDAPVTDPSDSTAETEEPEEPEPPKEYGYQEMGIDFAALAAQTSDKTIRDLHSYVASLTPVRQNEYTGMFAGKNLIVIAAESFSREVIDPVRTPTLYRLANRGIVFEDYYQPAWGGSTSTGEYSILTGLIPTNGVSSIKKTIGKNMYFCIGNQLQREGYFSRAYHNGSYTYYGRNETHVNLGYEKFIGMGNGMEQGVKNLWPESDLEMMQFTVDQYINCQPFSVYYMTVSGHCQYLYGNAMAKRNWDAVRDLEGSEQLKCYYACNLELEKALEYLVDRLEAAGIADDTVIVLSTDHYPYGMEKSDSWGNSEDHLEELYGFPVKNCMDRDHSALILWSGCLEKREEPIVVSTPTSSLDILPTLSNLFGVAYDSRLMVGRDVFSDQPPLVVWMDYSFLTDRGFYNASTGVFTPHEGMTADDSYIAAVKADVRNRFTFSRNVLNYDYYGILFGKTA